MGVSRHRFGEASSTHIAWCKCPFLPCAVVSFNKHVAKARSQGWPITEGNSHLSLTGLLTPRPTCCCYTVYVLYPCGLQNAIRSASGKTCPLES